MDIVIRQAAPPDFEQVGRIFAEENRFHAGLLPQLFRVTEPIMTREWFEGVLSHPDQALYVAEIERQVVGVLLLNERTSPDDPIFQPRRYAYVDEVAVAHAYRGRGIGRQLAAQANRWAVERGMRTIELDVWTANQRAIAFYEHLGYETTRQRMQCDIPD